MSRFTTKDISRIALFISLSIVIKMLMDPLGTATFRVTFYEIPVFISGIIYGPLVGGLVGFLTDVLYIVFSPKASSFNLMTVSSIMWGVIPGIMLYRKRARLNQANILLTLAIAALVAFLLNSIQLYYLWDFVMVNLPYRVAILFIKIPIQINIFYILYERVIRPELEV